MARYTYVYGYTVSEPDYMVGKEYFLTVRAASLKQAFNRFDQLTEGMEDDLGDPIDVELCWLEHTTDPNAKD